jgi:sirohydrochlorin ferrochelatase
VPKVQESSTTEVLLIRDELANMVWGVERVVPIASGESKPGSEAAFETLAFYRRELAARPGVVPPTLLDPRRVRALRGHDERARELDPVHPGPCRGFKP